MSFKALVIEDGPQRAHIRDLTRDDLPNSGDVLVRVDWSGINYKDALAVTGKGKIIRGDLPFVPGIDLAGTILESSNPEFPDGSSFVSTGWGVGEATWGGYSRIQRLSSRGLVPLPEGLTTRDSMIIGTAGFTAMLSLQAIQTHGLPKNAGEILVTGATGGVGSFSVLLLSKAGYPVTAMTGKAAAHEYLRSLGASEIISRDVLSSGAHRPLDKARWAGCIDSVGAGALEATLSQTMRHGVVAACGLAAGPELNTTVFPFILRGVRLIGIDSNTCPHPERRAAWKELAIVASEFDLTSLATTIDLEAVPQACEQILAGGIQGRYLVDLRNTDL